jgi:hypothetical protein
MSFIRRLFGQGDDEHEEEPSAPTRREDPGSDVAAARPPAEAPEPRKPIDHGPRTYLEFVGGSASKCYAAIIEPDEADGWRVWFTFGRIGTPREWALKVDGVDESKARRVYDGLIVEKIRKGYEARPWPAGLALPGGAVVDDPADDPGIGTVRGIYIATSPGTLPAAGRTAMVAGITLPPGDLIAPEAEGGPRGDDPVLWVSDEPLTDVVQRWAALARAFPDTGLWPLVVEPSHGIERMGEVLMDIPRSTGADPFQLLRRWWHANTEGDGGEDDEADEAISPFGRAFPGLAARTPGARPSSIEGQVRDLEGHLGLVPVVRPSRVPDAVGWMGPANYDLNPNEQSAILDTWEDRYDAYVVGLGFDTLVLAVGRPPRDMATAMAIAAEHFAFCPDDIWQGVGSIREYAELLVDAPRWEFWWD